MDWCLMSLKKKLSGHVSTKWKLPITTWRELSTTVYINTKLINYCTMIRAECLAMNRSGLTEERQILCPVREDGEYRRQRNQEIYVCVEKIMDIIWKRRISLYVHILVRLTNGIFRGENGFCKKWASNTKTSKVVNL